MTIASHSAFSIALSVTLIGALTSQSRPRKFYLPAVPHSYTTAQVPAGLQLSRLRGFDNTPPGNPTTDDGATFGRVLFYDRRLSRNHSTSCATCHQQARGFADARGVSRGFAGRATRRNAPGFANLGFHRSGQFFWDEREQGLENLVLKPIQDPIEMGLDLQTLVARLNADTAYRWLNRKAFGRAEIRAVDVARALAQFLRSMVSFRSRFDVGMARANSIEADFKNFTERENRGKRVFLGLHDDQRQRSCASCHMQLTSQGGKPGTPLLFQASVSRNNGLDRGLKRDDPGRGGVTEQPGDLGKFRAPSLRNIALTGPYMHDGRLKTLEDVIKFYTRGVRAHRTLDHRLISPIASRADGGWGGGRSIPTPERHPSFRSTTFPAAALGVPLSVGQRRELVAFLRTLTDWEFVRDPRFSDPFVKPRTGSFSAR